MLSSPVKETAIADVQLDDDGAPSQVNGYRVVKHLGEGTTSKVYQCQDENGQEFALKILNKSFLKRKREYKKIDGKMVFSNAFQKVQKEVAIMKKLAHNNLVKLHEIIDSPADDKMVLVLELITGGQVMKWEEKGFRYRCLRTSTGVLEQEDVRRCMRDVIDALDYLHKNSICHRDIKPENILLAADDTYKLADFGVAHIIDDSSVKKTLRNTEGTYHFLAPECTTGNEYDPYTVDIWALGVTMFTLLFGTLPFGTKAASLSDVMDSIRVDPLVLNSESIDAECEHLLRAMMTKDPNERITIEQLKSHPWLHQGSSQLAQTNSTKTMPVEVSREEIEAAFTPVNNFILMVRIKMKMAGRLARARTTIGRAKSQLSGQGDESPVPLRRTESSNSEMRHADELLPSIETEAVNKVASNHTSDAATTSSPTLTPSPGSSPSRTTITMLTRRLSSNRETTAPVQIRTSPTSSPETSPTRSAIAKLTKRLSSNRDPLVPIEAQCSAISPGHGRGISQPRPEQSGLLSRRKSSLNKIVVEVPPIDPTLHTIPDSPVSASHPHHQENSTTEDCSIRPSRPPPLQLPLPKLDVSGGSHSSPHTSPIHRQLTPRMSCENLARGWAEPDESVSIQRKFPSQRSPKFHHGIVYPDPSSEEPDAPKQNAIVADTSDSIAVTTSRSLPKRKTQDEAKIAIANIVHRTNTETTATTMSPTREPSVMLQRRKSSTPYPGPVITDTTEASMSTISEEITSASLPRLHETGRPCRPRDSESSSLAPVTKPHRKAAGTNSERNVRMEGGILYDNERASSYVSVKRNRNGDEEYGSDNTDENAALTDLSLDGGHMRPLECEKNHEGDCGSDPEATKTKTSPQLFGLFRKSSNNNVVPLELVTDTEMGQIDQGELCPSKRPSEMNYNNEVFDARPSPRLSPTEGGNSQVVGDSTATQSPNKSPSYVFSPRKTVLQSQETIRRIVHRRSELVKALLSPQKMNGFHQHTSLAAVAKRQTKTTEITTENTTMSPRAPYTNTIKSTLCVMQ